MKKIEKERIWVFSPVNQIVFKIGIQGSISEESLLAAIKSTVSQYEILNQKVTIDQEGHTYFDQSEHLVLLVEEMKVDWKETVKEQENIPFQIDQGEMIRFFYKITQFDTTLLILVHHIVGDGISFTYFVQDIMYCLAGNSVDYQPINLYDTKKLPDASKLKAPMTWLLKSMNKKWGKTGKAFGFNDYYKLYEKYWGNQETFIETYCLEGDLYNNLVSYSKRNHVTINSIIATAMIRAAGEFCDVGLAVSIREDDNTSMGNYATGISIQSQYKEKKSFLENVNNVQKLIYKKLDNPAKKYFLLQFMRNIEPTLIDAVYFDACGEYNNKTSRMFSKMFGYHGNPKGISITNLTKLPIEVNYGSYKISEFVFIPPLVLNAKRILGVASFDHKMFLSIHVNVNEWEEQRNFFYQGINYLKSIM